DPPAENCDFLFHVGSLPRPGLPAHHRGMARAQGGRYDGCCSGLLRDNLGRARAPGQSFVETMKLLITGVSHKTAPVEVRECLAFREDTLPAALADLKSREGVTECAILSTCNRVEITLTTDDRSDPQAIVDGFLMDRKS